MFKQLADLTARIFFLAKDTQQNKDDIKDAKQRIKDVQDDVNNLRREVQELAHGFERLAYELRHVRESEAQERKYLALQLENELLKFERRLSPGKSDSDEREKL